MLIIGVIIGSLLVAQNYASPSRQDPFKELEWWQQTVVYQIYPRSFYDSNDDGIGDLKGIEAKLDYFNTLGVKTIWLSPFFTSPMVDFGYDISDFTGVDEIFGTIEDFKSLVKTAKEKGIHIVLDLVPNHTSDQHVWFNMSRHRIEPYTDYFVWHDGKGPDKKEPPNNWLSVFRGSGWTYDEIRGQFYFHQFLKEQPDLNFRSKLVRKEMEDVISFWLELGVAGFRVDAYKHVFEDDRFLDEPVANDWMDPDEYGYLDHIYTASQPENFDMLVEWQELFQKFEDKDHFHRIIMLEVGESANILMNYYGNATHRLCDFPFNFELLWINEKTSGRDFLGRVRAWYDLITPGKWSNWLLGNHDQPRVANKISPELVDGLNMVPLLLPGTAITYYGEELGMENIKLTWEETQDPSGCNAGKDKYETASRDPGRSPMQWDDSLHGGFSKGKKTWLPVHPNYTMVNVKAQLKAKRSHLNIYRSLVALRQDPTIQYGTLTYPLVTDALFSFLRMLPDYPAFMVLINLSKEEQLVDFSSASVSGFRFPEEAEVPVASMNIPDDSPIVKDGKVSLANLVLGPHQSLLLKFEPVYE